MSSTVELLGGFVERGRHGPGEVVDVVQAARSANFVGESLTHRPWLPVSVPGSVLGQLPADTLLGTPRGILDDRTIRTIARQCPGLWVDGRWFPADMSGYHLLLVTTLSISVHEPLPDDVQDMLDVPSDITHRVLDVDGVGIRFLRLGWKPPRAHAS